MEKTLTPNQVRAFYNWFGSWQDRQRYENRAFDALVSHGDFGEAHAVFEFGCGTGRLAERLLRDSLPSDARYVAVDISETMVRLATARLRPWVGRAVVRAAKWPDGAECQFDRFIATYVFDLLNEDDARRAVAEAHRLLTAGGYLCIASLTFGDRLFSRIVTTLWRTAFAIRPEIVGGCRPVRLLDHVPLQHWHIVHHEMVSDRALTSEVLVAASIA